MTVLKHIFLLFLLMVCHILYSQKSYEFDYVLEYEYASDDGEPHNEYRFINSKDNGSMLMVWEEGKDIMMKLITKNGRFYYDKIIKEDFFVEAISLRCPYKGDTESKNLKDFDFIKQNDTLINTEKFGYFVINPTNKKDLKKDNLVPIHYIVDNKYNFNHPFFSPSELIFKKWEKGSDVPNGVLKECYSEESGKKKTLAKLLQIVPVKKIIIVDNNCK